MDDKAKTTKELRAQMALLKKEEERLRYLVTNTKTSPEYRKEAMAKLEEARRRIYVIDLELNERKPN